MSTTAAAAGPAALLTPTANNNEASDAKPARDGPHSAVELEKLNLFQRYLSVWVLLAMAAGTVQTVLIWGITYAVSIYICINKRRRYVHRRIRNAGGCV
ncbi:hypothetical protein H310_07494 [Aphanomyces invadans]|uniref:Uncharacterized protein n=1 Tax=Aphanomyces invadans TaxID=157072 RepID=A0A024U1D5_9STRA|nr:hypothetical protein H310_07494 [Aphanomyces invadans]ETW00064.1 hypothetical protein H310_07494 [Aphanomyces invadans]|eukprot:XP_008871089.1 hypothetical protein H310_07494 [Aphanomyces invadans]